jgi:hypothetical protein
MSICMWLSFLRCLDWLACHDIGISKGNNARYWATMTLDKFFYRTKRKDNYPTRAHSQENSGPPHVGSAHAGSTESANQTCCNRFDLKLRISTVINAMLHATSTIIDPIGGLGSNIWRKTPTTTCLSMSIFHTTLVPLKGTSTCLPKMDKSLNF